VFANVAGLPPMLIQVGDDEILLSDSTRLAEKLEAEGIEVELEVWPHMWHVFQMFIHKMPESGAAVRKIAAYIQRRFSQSGHERDNGPEVSPINRPVDP
jgi:acetyl esterase/lipase